MSSKTSWTETPNVVFELVPHLSGAQIKVLMFVCRKTYGYHEETARIGYNEFIEATGLSRFSVNEAITWLVDAGILERETKGNSFVYSLSIDGAAAFLENGSKIEQNLDDEQQKQSENQTKNSLKIRPNETVRKSDQSENQTENSLKIRPKTVWKSDQNTGVLNKKEKTNINTSNEVFADNIPNRPKRVRATDPQFGILKAAFVEAYGSSEFNHAQVGMGIKQLLGIGCTPDELKGCYEWVKSDTWWEFKPVYPQTLFKHLPEYRRYLERRLSTNGARNETRSGSYQQYASSSKQAEFESSLEVYAAFT